MSLLNFSHVPALEVSPCATVRQAVSCSLPESCGAVAVTDKGRLVGILTSRDVLLKVVLKRRNAASTRVLDVMSSPVLTVTMETPPEEALTMMLEHSVRHLPVIDEGDTLRGMLSLRRVLEFIVDDQRDNLHQMEAFLTADGPGG